MPIYMMFGRYTQQGMKGISAERTRKAKEMIEEHGGRVVSMYAVLGEDDLVLTLDLPDAEAAMAVSVGLHKLIGVAFRTSPVVEVEKFDALIGEATDI